MNIFFINSGGAGYAKQIEVPEGMTTAQLFDRELPGGRPDNHLSASAPSQIAPGLMQSH